VKQKNLADKNQKNKTKQKINLTRDEKGVIIITYMEREEL
jgi:hypothetical protein